MPRLVLQSVFGGDAFAEVGEPTGIYSSPDGRYLAVAGTVDDYAWSRGGYGPATTLLHRVVVYDTGNLDPIADTNAGRYRINDVAWHATEPIVAIGAGEYDGGFYFKGDLILWDLDNQRSARPFSLDGYPFGRQVVSCAFERDGSLSIQAMPVGGTASLTYYRVRSLSIPESTWRRFEDRVIPPFDHFDETEIARTGWEVVEELWPSTVPIMSELGAIAKGHGRSYEPRWMAWDVAWAPDGRVLAVRNGTALEGWRRDGTLEFRVPHRSDGTRVTVSPGGNRAYCCVWSRNPDDDFRENPNKYAAVLEIDLESAEAREVATDPTDTAPWGYRRLRMEGAPAAYYERASSEPRGNRLIPKSGWVATGDPTTAEVRDLFSLEWDEARDGNLSADASVYIDDDSGPALIIACHVISPPPTHERYLEINRRQVPSGECIWSERVDDPVVALAHLAGTGLVAFSLRDGGLGLLSAADGRTVSEEPASIDGIPTGILSLASREDEIAAGTIDGRVAIYRLEL